jgi:hypothetical protein
MSQQVNVCITNFELSVSGSGLLNRSDGTAATGPRAPDARRGSARTRRRTPTGKPRRRRRTSGWRAPLRGPSGCRPAGRSRGRTAPPRTARTGPRRDCSAARHAGEAGEEPFGQRESLTVAGHKGIPCEAWPSLCAFHPRYALALTSDLTAGETMPAGRQRNNGGGGFPRRRCCRIMSTI